MNNKIKKYIVSSADWSFEVDDFNAKDAAVSGLLFAYRKFRKDLLLSTVLMVNEKKFHKKNEVYFADFFPSYKILNEIGMHKEAKNFLEFVNSKHESEYIR